MWYLRSVSSSSLKVVSRRSRLNLSLRKNFTWRYTKRFGGRYVIGSEAIIARGVKKFAPRQNDTRHTMDMPQQTDRCYTDFTVVRSFFQLIKTY